MGFFAEDCAGRARGSGNGYICVSVVGGGDADYIGLFDLKHFAVVGVGPHIRPHIPPGFLELVENFRPEVANSAQLDAGMVVVDGGVGARHLAKYWDAAVFFQATCSYAGKSDENGAISGLGHARLREGISFKCRTAIGSVESSGEHFPAAVKKGAKNSEIILDLVIGSCVLEGATAQPSSGYQSFILWHMALA